MECLGEGCRVRQLNFELENGEPWFVVVEA
jgi:hypothetical protein